MFNIFSYLVIIVITIYLTLIITKYFNKNENLFLSNKLEQLKKEAQRYDNIIEKLDNQNNEMKQILNKNNNLINTFNNKKKEYKKVKKNIYKKYVSQIRPFDQRTND